MKQLLYKFIFFKVLGWKIVGSIDANVKKCVMIVVPHTSWYDFFLGVFTRGIVQLEMNFVGKKNCLFFL
jgi:1-acyl-sn-glycerol-3-phosphate acyltransferase